MGSVLAVGCALLVGATLGLLGAGGSIMTTPILVYLLRLEPKPAMSMSLVVVGATSLAAALLHGFEGRVRPRVAAPFALAGAPGAFLGGRLAARVPDAVLLVGFAVFMAAAALALWRRRDDAPGERAPAGPAAMAAVAGYGALVGVVTGLLGAGGGFLIVPALVVLAGLPMRDAIGTSLVVITVNAAVGVGARLELAAIRLELVAIFTAVAVLGAIVGHRLGRRVPVQVLRRVFAGLVLAVATYILARNLGGALGDG